MDSAGSSAPITFESETNGYVALGNPYHVEQTKELVAGDDTYITTDYTYGFEGRTSRLRNLDTSLTPKAAWNIYRSGPGTSYFSGLGGRGVNVNFIKDSKITSTLKF